MAVKDVAGRPWPDRRLIGLVIGVLGVVVLSGGLVVRLAASRDAGVHIGAVKDRRTTLPGSITGQRGGEGEDEKGGKAGKGGKDREADVRRVASDDRPGAATSAEDGPGIRAPGAPGPARRPSGRRLLPPSGRPPKGPIPFNASIPVPDGLVWVLLVGSDARPGEPPLRARADSIHLLAANPATGQATIVGFPRDSFVEIPGHGTGKINTALVLGGPELLAKTVNRLTGLPVQLWVVAGFDAFTKVVDEVGGLDVEVRQAMDDWDSGARFLPGHHHFDGQQALAFSRDRHDFPDGDLTRSRNQGVLVLAALAKLRAEVGDEAGLGRWVGVAFRHLTLDIDLEQARRLLAVARRTDPADVTNLVLPGRGGMAGAQSVVYLDREAAARIVDDLRPDAAIGPAKPPLATTTTTTAPSPAAPPAPAAP